MSLSCCRMQIAKQSLLSHLQKPSDRRWRLSRG